MLAGLFLVAASSLANAADGPFAPAMFVNDSVISQFELDQRILFLNALNFPGDVEEQAMTGLIEDKLRLQAAKTAGTLPNEVEVTRGMQEFAGRSNVTLQQFVEAIGQKGVAPETYRDFVRAGVAWRGVIRQRFGGTVRITDAEVDRALSDTALRGSARVLLSELIVPAPPGQEADALAQVEELRSSIRGEADFAAAARQYSASSSAQAGGQIDWLDVGKLPPALRQMVLGLAPGQVSDPLPIPNAYAIFLLRALQPTAEKPQVAIDVDYVEVILPDGPEGQSWASTLMAKADTCTDVVRLTSKLPAQQVIRTVQPAGAVPRDVGLELARLDTFETSFSLRRGGSRVFLMLCGRTMAPVDETSAEGLGDVQEAPDADAPGPKEPKPTPTREEQIAKQRDAMRMSLTNQRLSELSEQYMQQLKAAAIIREP
ncbi:peptidylprolyl isomerase [Tabrizicola sp. J26]|uniref:peptidylprolyl isomerase n=1 Tax=Alitabrizicola rongguiensis TaxID=2909234 RepID=UPI001F48E33E|nr:peptidylprolyl isomerase [Tabrizicola rongguiensis]MCF1709969.1 peptidylprolyl isomerase [Tabrizicola rongguiensis]